MEHLDSHGVLVDGWMGYNLWFVWGFGYGAGLVRSASNRVGRERSLRSLGVFLCRFFLLIFGMSLSLGFGIRISHSLLGFIGFAVRVCDVFMGSEMGWVGLR